MATEELVIKLKALWLVLMLLVLNFACPDMVAHTEKWGRKRL
jgi:hypothetical protein